MIACKVQQQNDFIHRSLQQRDEEHMLQQAGPAHNTEQTLFPSELTMRYAGGYINAPQTISNTYVQDMHRMQCLTLNSEHHAFLSSKPPSLYCIKAVTYSPLQNSVAFSTMAEHMLIHLHDLRLLEGSSQVRLGHDLVDDLTG